MRLRTECLFGARSSRACQFSQNRNPASSWLAIIILGEQGRAEKSTGVATSKQASSCSLFSEWGPAATAVLDGAVTGRSVVKFSRT